MSEREYKIVAIHLKKNTKRTKKKKINKNKKDKRKPKSNIK